MNRFAILTLGLMMAPVAMAAEVTDTVAGAEIEEITEIAEIEEKPSAIADSRGLFQTITGIEKKTDKFNLILNMHGDFDANWRGSRFQDGKFQMRQLRVEARGNITPWLSFRYRQRLNKGDEPGGYYDNVLQSIDYACIGVRVGKWQFTLGKQVAAYGGIEFETNPIQIYEFSEITGTMTNFMTGIDIGYNFTPKQQLRFQVLNGLIKSSQKTYGDYAKAKMPLMYTLNWNGTFGDIFRTRWSASVMSETQKEYWWYFALGNELRPSSQWLMYFDWMYSRGGVDRNDIMTDILHPEGDVARKSQKVDYNSLLLHVNYRFLPKWQLFAKGLYETSGMYKDYNGFSKGVYRTSIGYVGGIEFYPMADSNLHFFAAYCGRSYRFTDRAKALGNSNYSTNKLAVGFIWAMPVF